MKPFCGEFTNDKEKKAIGDSWCKSLDVEGAATTGTSKIEDWNDRKEVFKFENIRWNKEPGPSMWICEKWVNSTSFPFAYGENVLYQRGLRLPTA